MPEGARCMLREKRIRALDEGVALDVAPAISQRRFSTAAWTGSPRAQVSPPDNAPPERPHRSGRATPIGSGHAPRRRLTPLSWPRQGTHSRWWSRRGHARRPSLRAEHTAEVTRLTHALRVQWKADAAEIGRLRTEHAGLRRLVAARCVGGRRRGTGRRPPRPPTIRALTGYGQAKSARLSAVPTGPLARSDDRLPLGAAFRPVGAAIGAVLHLDEIGGGPVADRLRGRGAGVGRPQARAATVSTPRPHRSMVSSLLPVPVPIGTRASISSPNTVACRGNGPVDRSTGPAGSTPLRGRGGAVARRRPGGHRRAAARRGRGRRGAAARPGVRRNRPRPRGGARRGGAAARHGGTRRGGAAARHGGTRRGGAAARRSCWGPRWCRTGRWCSARRRARPSERPRRREQVNAWLFLLEDWVHSKKRRTMRRFHRMATTSLYWMRIRLS